jgi:hypothetical protein
VKAGWATYPRALRVAGGALVALVLFLESGCGTGRPPSASSRDTLPRSTGASVLEAYERARARAWDPSRRFKALFKAEVSPKIGAIGRGYLSVWWDGATGTLAWRASAPLGGAGRGGFLRKGNGDGGAASGALLPGRLSSIDVLASLLGSPDAPASSSSFFEETPRGWSLRIDSSKRSVLVDREGMPIEFSFPTGETVKLQPGEGVPRRIEANGRDGRAVLTLESYSSWPEGEPVPPV